MWPEISGRVKCGQKYVEGSNVPRNKWKIEINATTLQFVESIREYDVYTICHHNCRRFEKGARSGAHSGIGTSEQTVMIVWSMGMRAKENMSITLKNYE